MKKIYSISGNWTDEEKEVLIELIELFRLRMADDDPEKNLLLGKAKQYSDNRIVSLIKSALSDINSGFPRTNYTVLTFDKLVDDDMLVNGAMVFAMIGEGVLQLRNQIDYSDSGLSIAMFNKTQMYQGWAGFMLQQYIEDKKEVKASVIPRSGNAGFIGVGTEFGYDGW